MEYYGIVESHLSGLYLLFAKEVRTLDMNDFLQESNPDLPFQYRSFVLAYSDALYSDSSEESGSKKGDPDNEVLSCDNPSPNNFGDNYKFKFFDDSGPKIDEFWQQSEIHGGARQ
jgi:hypothetical protein